jgi:hypothetical protein
MAKRLEKIEIRVKNAGFYGEDENGTWEEIREALAEKVPGWSECSVTKHSYIGGRKHYWGELIDENRNKVYTFYAVFDAEEGEIEVQKA